MPSPKSAASENPHLELRYTRDSAVSEQYGLESMISSERAHRWRKLLCSSLRVKFSSPSGTMVVDNHPLCPRPNRGLHFYLSSPMSSCARSTSPTPGGSSSSK